MEAKELNLNLKELFYYKEGYLYHKYNKGKHKKDTIVGSVGNHGYVTTMIKKQRYLIHRLIYAYHFGAEALIGFEIDHIDRDKTNNSIENLRLVKRSQNMHNTKAKGVSFKKSNQKWVAQIQVNKKRKHLGYFNTEEEAINVYNEYKGLIRAEV